MLLNDQPSADIPLVLDLDGTLIQTDTFHEMTFLLLFKKPWFVPFIPFWLLKSRSFAKARLAKLIHLSPHKLPYNTQLLAYARDEKRKGRSLILATGSDQSVAKKIADHLGIFKEVIASDGMINMTGPRKTETLLKRFGKQGFDYAGDAHIDLHIWKVSRKAIVVRPKRGVLKRVLALKGHEHTHHFQDSQV